MKLSKKVFYRHSETEAVHLREPLPSTLLIVDDSPANRSLLKNLLKKTYRIIEAENGATALKLLRSHSESISLILLDSLMPVLNSHDFMLKVKADATLAKIPIIVMTSDVKATARNKALKDGADDFLIKPFDPILVKRRIDNLIYLQKILKEMKSIHLFLNRLPGCIFIFAYTHTLSCRYVSNGIETLSGYTTDAFYDLFASDFLSIVLPEDRANFLDLFKNTLETPAPITIDYRIRQKNGEIIWNRMQAVLAATEASTPLYYAVASDITLQKNAADRLITSLLKKAQYDSLTQIYNRQAFEECLHSLLDNAPPERMSALLIMDLDNFKQVNDTYGHLQGDSILIRVAALLKSILDPDTLLGRLGGDEFILFIPNLSQIQEVASKGQEICQSIKTDRTLIPFSISCSIGAALSPSQGTTFVELYKKADFSLYHAKKAGKSKCHLYDTHWLKEDL